MWGYVFNSLAYAHLTAMYTNALEMNESIESISFWMKIMVMLQKILKMTTLLSSLEKKTEKSCIFIKKCHISRNWQLQRKKIIQTPTTVEACVMRQHYKNTSTPLYNVYTMEWARMLCIGVYLRKCAYSCCRCCQMVFAQKMKWNFYSVWYKSSLTQHCT